MRTEEGGKAFARVKSIIVNSKQVAPKAVSDGRYFRACRSAR